VKLFKEDDLFHIRKWGREFIFQFLVIKNRKADDPNDTVCIMQHGAVKWGHKTFIEYNENTRDKAIGLDDLEVMMIEGLAYKLVLSGIHVIPDAEDTHKDLMRFIPMEVV
jgi:hypothetical protein